MASIDAQETLDLALQASGLDHVKVRHRPRILSDNGPSYVSEQFADWLAEEGFTHTRGAPYHPQTQGKIERWHQTLKNRILLENYFLPGDLTHEIDAFVDHYNHRRYHESLNPHTFRVGIVAILNEDMPEAKGMKRGDLRKAMERLFTAKKIEAHTYRNTSKGRDVTVLREVDSEAPNEAPEPAPNTDTEPPQTIHPNAPPHTPVTKVREAGHTNAPAPDDEMGENTLGVSGSEGSI